MNLEEQNLKENWTKEKVPFFVRRQGLFHSVTVTNSPEEVFKFCQDSSIIEQTLEHLPLNANNILDLSLVSANQTQGDHYIVKWQNRPEFKFKGTLTLELRKAPYNQGTVITSIAEIHQFKSTDEEPSDFILFFLRRLKCLIETGVIATTKGQPSGRDELDISDKQLH
jgi:hypothetical protein